MISKINGGNKVVLKLHVVQFWSEIILVISNRTHAARSFDLEITSMISDQIALHSVQLPLLIRLSFCRLTSAPAFKDFSSSIPLVVELALVLHLC